MELGEYSGQLTVTQYTTSRVQHIVGFIVLKLSDWCNKKYIKK